MSQNYRSSAVDICDFVPVNSILKYPATVSFIEYFNCKRRIMPFLDFQESDSDEEKNNYIEICSLLLKSGANALAEIVDTDLGRTKVLEDAIEMNSTELLHLLCEGHYLNLKQNYLLRGKRKSLIICAVECMSVKTFDYIFEKGE